jgi:hypothetical protein
MASFVSLELQPQSAVKMLNMQQYFQRENNKGRTVHCVLEWSGLFLFLITTLHGDVASLRNWRRNGYFAPKSCDCHMWSNCDFGTHCYMTDLQICPKTAIFNDLFMTQVLNPPLGEGGGWLGSPSFTPPPPTSGNSSFLPHSP